MGHDKKTASEAAEMLALRTILTNVLLQIGKLDPHLQYAITQGFDDAAAFVLHSDQPRSRDRYSENLEAVRVIEEVRAATLGDKGPSLAPMDS